MNKILTTLAFVFSLGLLVPIQADPPSSNVTTFATGLIQPRGLKFGPDGNLYVAEAGTGGSLTTTGMCDQLGYRGGFTARVSKIAANGSRTTVADNLASTTDNFDDTMGVSDVAFVGNTLYALLAGAGCTHGHATNDNAVLRVNTNGSTTLVANLSTYLATHPVVNQPSDLEPDGTWYNMIAVGGDLVAVNPNQGNIERITTTGTISRIVDFSINQGHIVPTAMTFDGDLYVGNLGVFPIVQGSAKILKVTLTGQVTTFATGLTTVLGLALDSAHRLYVLENSTGPDDFPTPGTGKVVRITQSGGTEVIASGLSLPTAMTLGPDGNLYISNWGFGMPNMGEIVKINLQRSGSQFANVSARGSIQTGDNVLITGFILQGSNRIIVRAIGPSLPLSGRLADPVLELHNGQGALIASNDNWRSAQQAEIVATGIAPMSNLESAIVKTLGPGSYTAVVRGKNGGTGIGLVEMYSLLH
jgi:hypothetical protein